MATLTMPGAEATAITLAHTGVVIVAVVITGVVARRK
jgi:hypothetical protein